MVGLPGDRIKVISDRIYVNDVPLDEKDLGRYSDGCYEDMRLAEVHTGEHVHRTISAAARTTWPDRSCRAATATSVAAILCRGRG